MRYLRFYPSIGKNICLHHPFENKEDCDSYCIETNQELVRRSAEQSIPAPMYRYQTVPIFHWPQMIMEASCIALMICFAYFWYRGLYQSALCAFGARVLLWGLPVKTM